MRTTSLSSSCAGLRYRDPRRTDIAAGAGAGAGATPHEQQWHGRSAAEPRGPRVRINGPVAFDPSA
uniref:Kip1 n=1 Tax=Arundo donax TaxID=35708 RepID=A0A0A9CXK8_ARUDO